MLAVKAIKELKKGFGDAAEGVGKAVDFFKNFDLQAHKTTLIIIGVAVALVALAVAIAHIMGKGDQFKQSMESISDTAAGLRGAVNPSQNSVHGYADGTLYHPGGLAWVGERGPELVDLPRGSKVYTSDQSRAMTGGGDTFNFNVNMDEVSEVQKLMRVAKTAQQTARAGEVPV